MALISPGVEVTVIDESQYIPAATNSVPYVLIATAQNKISGTGTGVAAGTLKANANKPYLITSQRDLSATFGVPFFYKTTAGTPINGYELNEYGLLAAYSALGITNRCYVQRADIDLTELTASLVRPTGNPNNGEFWLDTANSTWGLFQWNQTTGAFTNKVPTVITDSTNLQPSTTIPLNSIGAIGDYAVNATYIHNPMYYKRGGPSTSTYSATVFYTTSGSPLLDLYNTWVQIGSDDWKTAWPTVQGTTSTPSLTDGDTIFVNGTEVDVGNGLGSATVAILCDNINGATITGVYAAVNSGKLVIYTDSTADGGDSATNLVIQNGTGTPLTEIGIEAGGYYAPAFQASPSYTIPRWRTTDTVPEPTGSVWQKTNNVNLGANIVLKKYNSTLGTWVQQSVPIYENGIYATYGLDPSGGGTNIPIGTTWARLNPDYNDPTVAALEIEEYYATGPTIITGDTTTPGPFSIGNSFAIAASIPGSVDVNVGVATLAGTTSADFVQAVQAANVPYVSASLNSDGSIVFTHSAGGTINLKLRSGGGTPFANAGFNTSVKGIQAGTPAGDLVLSNFTGYPYFTYTASATAPDQDPDNGRYWYYSATNQADIMIQNNGMWMGYQNVTNDVRGFNLSNTNQSGPIFSATAPTTENDTNQSQLQPGDLWIDTSDLENYPALYRWEILNNVYQWVKIDNTDQTTENGILFADARWSSTGTVNPITDAIPTIDSLLTSDYIDIDAPDPTLYPEGMLLFNTRRSGYNVKSFQVDYFNGSRFNIGQWDASTTYAVNDFVINNTVIYVATASSTNVAPPNTSYWAAIQTNSWVTASGNKSDGSPYMGRQAQRAIIVAALKSGIDSSTDIREEQRQFNLITCPQYPELIPNMVTLNNDRNQTAFVIGDTPLRLGPDGTLIQNWRNDNAVSAGDGLTTSDTYLGVYYPSCQTTDLSGSLVVQPPSHMILRTTLRSDEVSYPWLAAAGTRRGVVDNALRLGYIEATTGEFVTLGVNQALRDVLYDIQINPITFVPGVGITNFGNKTATSITTAMNRINVARLIAFIRGRLQEIGKTFLFEPNDQITRNEMSNAVNSLMIDLVNKRGIYDYLVVCDLTNNTPARIDRNELWVDIAIEPVKAVEFIYIPLRIKNTGEIAAGVSTVAVQA